MTIVNVKPYVISGTEEELKTMLLDWLNTNCLADEYDSVDGVESTLLRFFTWFPYDQERDKPILEEWFISGLANKQPLNFPVYDNDENTEDES